MLAIKPVVNVKSVVSLFSLILLPLLLIGCNSSSSGSGAAPAVTDPGVTPSVVAPTVMLSGEPANYGNTVAFEVIATFSAAVTDFVAADVNVTGATVTAVADQGSGTAYTLTVKPTSATAGITLSIPAGRAGGNVISNELSVSYVAPIMAPADAAALNGKVYTMTEAALNATFLADGTNTVTFTAPNSISSDNNSGNPFMGTYTYAVDAENDHIGIVSINSAQIGGAGTLTMTFITESSGTYVMVDATGTDTGPFVEVP